MPVLYRRGGWSVNGGSGGVGGQLHMAPSLGGTGGKRVPGGDGGKRVPGGDGGKRVPSGHNAEGVSDPQLSTEASADHGQWAARRLRLRR